MYIYWEYYIGFGVIIILLVKSVVVCYYFCCFGFIDGGIIVEGNYWFVIYDNIDIVDCGVVIVICYCYIYIVKCIINGDYGVGSVGVLLVSFCCCIGSKYQQGFFWVEYCIFNDVYFQCWQNVKGQQNNIVIVIDCDQCICIFISNI